LIQKGSEKSEEFDEISELDEDIEHRPDLTPPEKPKVVWGDYINSPDGQWPCLSRPIRCKESKKEFKAQLAIVIFINFSNLSNNLINFSVILVSRFPVINQRL
jgi:hypothetical protein